MQEIQFDYFRGMEAEEKSWQGKKTCFMGEAVLITPW